MHDYNASILDETGHNLVEVDLRTLERAKLVALYRDAVNHGDHQMAATILSIV